MSRLPRYLAPDQPQHVVLRGNDRQAVFRRGSDFALFRDWLAAAAREHGLSVHAYVWMSNHVHLLVTPAHESSVAKTIQAVGRHYVPYFNRSHERTGALWEGRYKATVVDSERYLLACMRYIEENPVRAGMVDRPERYRWSSFRGNALGSSGPDQDWLTPHPVYLSLARDADERRAAYRALFADPLPDAEIQAIRYSVNRGWALGRPDFLREIERQTARRSEPLPPGPRPRRATSSGSDPKLFAVPRDQRD